MIDSGCLEIHGLDRNGQAGKDLKKLEMIEAGKEKNIMEMVVACEMDYLNVTVELETIGLPCMANELKVIGLGSTVEIDMVIGLACEVNYGFLIKELEVTGWIYIQGEGPLRDRAGRSDELLDLRSCEGTAGHGVGSHWGEPGDSGGNEETRTSKLEKQVEELKQQLERQVRRFQAPDWSSLFNKEESRKGVQEDRTEDSLRSFPIVLPKLPEPTVRNSSLEAGDWLTQVGPLIADVSASAVQWWDAVVEGTFKQYRLWLAATPLERLRIPAPDEQELSKGFRRLAQRVSVMLIQSLPDGLKQEMIAMRQMDCVNILYKIFKTYQPGGLAERRQMLAELTVTGAAKTADEAVASLRLWKRQAQRAQELRVTMPDTVLQVKALSTIMEELLAGDTQAHSG